MAARARGGLPPLRGPWAQSFAALASPVTSALAGALATAVVAWGLTLGTPLAAVNAPLLHLALAVLAFSVAARALSLAAADRRAGLAPGLFAVGLLVTVVGGAVAGRDQGEVVLGGAEAVESFTVPVGGERLGMHLGGVLSATATEAGLALSIGVRDHRVGEAVLPNRPGAEVALGPWSVFTLRTEPAGAPGGARLRVTPRAGGEPRDFSVRVGNQLALEDGTRIGLNRVSADFGRALGPAAQITPVAPGARDGVGEGRWLFTEAPDLDARLGDDAWVVQLLGLEAAPRPVLGVRRRGPVGPLFAGLALMLAALLLGMRRPA